MRGVTELYTNCDKTKVVKHKRDEIFETQRSAKERQFLGSRKYSDINTRKYTSRTSEFAN